MRTARRRRTSWAIAASVLAHVAVLTAALAYRPHLVSPFELGNGPPEPVIPVFLTPRSHLAQRNDKLAAPAPASRPPPVLMKPAPAATAALPTNRAALAAPSATAAPADSALPAPDIRAALRHGAAGCANAATVGMTRAEREHCEEQLAAGGKTSPVMALAMEPRMRAYYDAIIKAKAPDKPWTPNRAIGAVGIFDPEPRVSSSGDHPPGIGCVIPFGPGKKKSHKEMLPHALWLGPCFIEPPKGPLDPEVDVPVP